MIVVPQNKLVIIPENDLYKNSMELIVEPFKGNKKRDWFIQHAYFCLPLVIGNQYGFGIRALKTFSVIWDGGDSPAGVKVEILDAGDTPDYQSISSHFGMGTVTIQNRFTFRTPPNVNLMTINPPNYWIDGIQHMTGVVETDNLRRDFTFNLKVTRVNEKIIINKGDFIGCVLPIPRYFSDSFELVSGYDIFTEEQIKEEQQIMRDFGKERSMEDRHKKNGNGRRYHNGEDVYGNKFEDHQRGM
jgi:hypothetical protein